ncbi:AP-3 complex subunit beta, partial [Angomonas deanei]
MNNIMEQASYATGKAIEYVSSASEAINNARSLVSGDSQFFATIPKADETRRALSSESIYEKRDAMKRIIAQMCKGNNMKYLFPDVVKNIYEPSIELRKLVYFFVVHYAEDCPDEALLAISAFQKDLVHSSMHVRSLALRMLSSLRIPSIYPVVMVAVQKCSQDITAHVRKTAAIALTQLYALSPEQTNLSSVKKVLSELLADKNADVVGAAAMAFNRICPDDVDVIHPVFMNLCTQVNHAEEIGQVFILKLLLRYCRLSFKNVEGTEKDATTVEKKSHSASSDDESSSSSSSSSEADLNEEEQVDLKLDRDLLLVLRNVRKLLRTTNSAVLIAVCNIYFFCSPKHHCTECIKPLVRFVGSGSDESLPIILSTIHGFICQKDCVFEKYYKDFYVNPEDARDVYLLKIAILGRLVNASNADDILNEFKAYVHGFNTDVVLEGIQGLQRIASAHPEFSSRIVRLLQPLFSETNPRVVADAISVFRLLVMQKKESEETSKYVFKLMNQVVQGEIVSPVAVKSVLWLVGENIPQHEAIAGGAPDCFRVFLKQFPDLDSSVKEEVLILGCKIWFHLEGQSELSERFKNMYLFALKYASFDDDYVIRDLGRMLEGTKERDSPLFQLAKSALLSEKPSPSYTEPHSDRRSTELGTLTNYLGFPVFDYKAI